MMGKTGIFAQHSLTDYFYQNLEEVNKKSLCPLPQEFIFYTSKVLDNYALSENFFEASEGKVNDKVLGIKYLEAGEKKLEERKLIYKDIGDTVLVQLGFFTENIQHKLSSETYYLNLGKSAYATMEKLDCSFYDIPEFYRLFATSLESMVKLLSMTSESFKFDSFEDYLLDMAELDSKKAS